jgi:flagellar hook assembly protein FlgD
LLSGSKEPVSGNLLAVYPNPMSSEANFSVNVAKESVVRLEILSPEGKLIAIPVDRKVNAGYHLFNWDGKLLTGSAVPSGICFYRLILGDKVLSGKLSVVR